MISLTGVKIKTTTYPDFAAIQSFFSYTLSNTPFYFKLQWVSNDENYRNLFSRNQILWDFGDGEFYVGETAEHYYKWPGSYLVTATIYDVEGNTYTLQVDNFLQVYNAVPDLVSIGDLGGSVAYPIEAGKKTPPLKIFRSNSWQYDSFLNGKNYTVNLYASGCRSNFISVSSYYSNSWSHLKTYFGFIETTVNVNNILEDKIIDSTTTTSASVYAERINTGFINNSWDVKLKFYSYPEKNTVFCGTTGALSNDKILTFVDQRANLDNIYSFDILYASFDSTIFKDANYLKYNYNSDDPYGFINYPYTAQFIKSLFNPATGIKITSNGISVEGPVEESNDRFQRNYSFDIYPIKYTDSKINFVCTFKDKDNFTTKCYPPLKLNQNKALELNDIRVTLMEYNGISSTPITGVNIYKNIDIPDYNNSGSYFAGILESKEERSVVALSAISYIVDEAYTLPTLNYGYIMQPGLNQFRRIKNEFNYGYYNNSEKFKTGVKSKLDTYKANVSGGVNITYAPLFIKDPLSGGFVWITNSANDSLLLFDTEGQQKGIVFFRRLRVFRPSPSGIGGSAPIINALGDNRSASPCNIAIDSNGDAWVTLRDTITSFKLDKNTLIATKVIIPSVKSFPFYSSDTDYLSLCGFAGEDSVLPSSIDVDRNDNVYISYTNTLCSFIAKYDKDGKELLKIPFLFPYTIKQLLIDTENNIWATSFNNAGLLDELNVPQTTNIVNRVDLLYYIDQKNPLNNFVKRFSMLGDLTMDSGGNVWVNSQNNTINRITKDGNVISFLMGNPESVTDYIQDFGGLAGDLDGNLWVINNSEGLIQFFDTKNPRQLDPSDYSSTIIPGILPAIVLPDTFKTVSEEGTFAYYQTIGDFTGIRWALKNRVRTTTAPRIVTGTSNYFTIRKPESIVVKKNENYDLATTIRSYALQESLYNSTDFFNNFLTPILNGNTGNVDELGKVIYEKITNFVDNNSDIDKCNLRSLQSIYEMFGEEFTDFYFSAPPFMRRVIDLLSIKKCILYGNFNTFNRQFILSSFEYSIDSNLGAEIDIETGKFTPGLPIITYEYFSKKYNLVHNTLVKAPGLSAFKPYPLSAINYNWGWGLITGNIEQDYREIKNYYKFFAFKPTNNKDLYDGLIDFDDSLTRLEKEIIDFNEWKSYAGTMEYIIGGNLYKNLKQFKIQ